LTARRAAILKEALEFFNVYGELLPVILAEQRADDQPQEWDEPQFFEFVQSLADEAAIRSAKERTEINATAQNTLGADVARNFKALSRPTQSFLVEQWRRFAESNSNSDSSSTQSTKEEDNLDRYYSAEVVDKLPLIVRRASQLSPLQITAKTPLSPDVERYFAEAHQCYLYGSPWPARSSAGQFWKPY
jgi:hypothetical protein